MPLPATGRQGLTTGSAADLIADRYPYPRDLYFYIRREPGTPLDPLVAEYVKLVLSKQGQEAVAADPKGYLPLNAPTCRKSSIASTALRHGRRAPSKAPSSTSPSPRLNP